MKKKQKEEIRGKSLAELQTMIAHKELAIGRLISEIKTGKAKNTSANQRERDELAILKTILGEKRLSSVDGEEN